MRWISSALALVVVLALPASAGAAESTAPVPHARPDLIHRGRAVAVTPRGRLLLVAFAKRRSVTIVRRRDQVRTEIPIPGEPLEVAISPGGRWGAVTTGFWKEPAVVIIDMQAKIVRTRLDAGPAPFGVAFAQAAGHRLLVSGGEQKGTLAIHSHPDFARVREVALGRVPRGIALTPDGGSAWVALNGEDAVVRVDLVRGVVTGRIATGPQPDRVAVSPGGRHLLVSHGGARAHAITQIDTKLGSAREIEVGPRPTAVAWSASGKRLVALGGSDRVVVLGKRGRRAQREVAPGPRGLVLARNHAFTVSALTGAVSKVRV